MPATPENLLQRHRARRKELMREYLQLLERQEQAIHARSLDQLARTIERERELLAAMEDRHRTIRALNPDAPDPAFERDRAAAVNRQARNRELLADYMSDVRERIHGVQIPRRARSVYRMRDAGGMIDLTT